MTDLTKIKADHERHLSNALYDLRRITSDMPSASTGLQPADLFQLRRDAVRLTEAAATLTAVLNNLDLIRTIERGN